MRQRRSDHDDSNKTLRLSGYDETMDAIRRIARVPGGRYFMQEQNVFIAGESRDAEMTEFPVAPYPAEAKERPED